MFARQRNVALSVSAIDKINGSRVRGGIFKETKTPVGSRAVSRRVIIFGFVGAPHAHGMNGAELEAAAALIRRKG